MRFLMRIAIFALLACAGYGQVKSPTVSEVEAMEKFAQSGARVVWSEEVDRVSSGTATAVITAVILEDAGRQMRGVRIDLADGDVKDRVYTGEPFVERFIAEMDEIATGMLGFFGNSESAERAPNRCFGSGILLRARREGAHIFGASQCSETGGWTGLVVSTRSATVPVGPAVFRFPGLNPSPFAAAMARARDGLAKR